MATTVHEPPQIKSPRRSTADSGGGGWRNLVPAGGNLRAVRDDSSPASRTGIWVAIAAITMTFLAFTSALVVRQGASNDWRHMQLPGIIYFNTLALLASSFTLEAGRRGFRAMQGDLSRRAATLRALYATLGLGLVFVAGQYMAWLQLKAEGLYLATNPSSSFFYVFTAVHGLHVLGGLAGLVYVIRKLNRNHLHGSTLKTASHYWHFMDVLWLYLLLVLWMKL
ncbi:MAG TPA: cytochrome c oxidase subunit 3 [Terriglobales bacterium]|nr:cytochrome c oxidase subunit 3 [Terriglobales bacterium]